MASAIDMNGIAVVFDGDDTLWSTETLYDTARLEARNIVSRAGFNGDEWEAIQRRVDVENVAVFRFSPERFPTSCVQAYELVCTLSGKEPESDISSEVREAAATVFLRDPEVFSGTTETLSLLHDSGCKLALLTKGDLRVQSNRIDRSGLRRFFHSIRIVDEKNAMTIQDVVAELGTPTGNAWMVGNSVKSDILPALEAGLRAVWIEAHVWEFERTHDHLLDDRVVVAKHIGEVPDLITRAAIGP